MTFYYSKDIQAIKTNYFDNIWEEIIFDVFFVFVAYSIFTCKYRTLYNSIKSSLALLLYFALKMRAHFATMGTYALFQIKN